LLLNPRSVEPLADDLKSGSARRALVIDDEPQFGRFLTGALRQVGVSVSVAQSGADGIDAARRTPFGVILLDLALQDIPGLEVVRTLRRERADIRLVVFSGVLSVDVAVEVMKLGACDAVQKPFTGDRIRAVVCAALATRPVGHYPWQVEPHVHRDRVAGLDATLDQRGPTSISARWARIALKGCRAIRDVKTLDEWARAAGVSYTTLCEACRLAGMKPREARDLVRLTRAILKAAELHCPFEMLLDVADRRTLGQLLDKSGLLARGGSPKLADLLANQQFVPRQNECLRLLRELLDPSDPA
jgi:ActR/RegA family two-component response regulator